MRADKATCCRDITQQIVQPLPGTTAVQRIDPHQYAISPHELRTNLVLAPLGIDGGLGRDADRRKFEKDAVMAFFLGRCGRALRTISPPYDRNFVRRYRGTHASSPSG